MDNQFLQLLQLQLHVHVHMQVNRSSNMQQMHTRPAQTTALHAYQYDNIS
jgi:hypothetical protein